MYIGGSVGPPGTRVEVRPRDPAGPYVQLQHEERAADSRPDRDRFDLGFSLGAECGRSAERLGDSGRAFLVRHFGHDAASFLVDSARPRTCT